MKISIFVLIVIVSGLAKAQSASPDFVVPKIVQDGLMMHPTGRAECDDAKFHCSYKVAYASNDKIIEAVVTKVLSGNAITADDRMYLSTYGDEIIFGVHPEGKDKETQENLQKIYEELKVAIPSFDRADYRAHRPFVDLKVEIFAVSQKASDNLSLAIKNIQSGAPSNFQKGVSTDGSGQDLSFGFSLGSATVSGVMAWGRSTSDIQRIDTIRRFVQVGTPIAYSDLKKYLYAATPNVPEPKEWYVGTEINGKVSLDVTDDQKPVVVIDGFDVSYSTSNGNLAEGVQKVDIPYSTIFVFDGPFAILNARKAILVKETSKGFLGFGKKKDNEERYLLITVEAKPLSFKAMNESVQIAKKLRDAPTLSQEDLKGRRGTDTKAALESFKPYSHTLDTGEVIFGFTLDPQFATLDNYERIIDIELNDLGVKYKNSYMLQSLMLGDGFRLSEAIPFSKLRQDKLKFRVELTDTVSGIKKQFKLIYLRHEKRVLIVP